MASWTGGCNGGGTGTSTTHPPNVLMMRKDHHPAGHTDSGLVAMLSSAGLRGLDRSPPQQIPGGTKRPLYTAMLDSLDESGDGEIADDGSTGGAGYSEKKRRLSAEQVRSLEMSFETENRLEPVRKMQLAQELGLQPRQVAVWFQNRRARWKTKQLERDYEILKAAYESVAEENKKLKAQLQKLTDVDNDENVLLKNEEEHEAEESGAAGAHKHLPALKKKKNKSSGVEDLDETTCTSPDSPTVVSSKFKESPSSDGYGSDVLDTLSPHAAAAAAAAVTNMASAPLPTEEVSLAIKEEPVTFPYKLDEDDALRGLEDEASYSCLFGAAEEQANWAWWDWS